MPRPTGVARRKQPARPAARGVARRKQPARPGARGVTTLLATLALAGCGGDDGGDDREPRRAVTVPAGATLPVVGDEYSFDPARVIVRGAGRLEIRLRNAGSLAHNLKLFKDGEEVGGTPTFQGGRTEAGVVNLEHGRYEMVCTVGNHADLGMIGELEVR